MGANIIVTMDESGGKEKKTDSGILVAASVKNDGPKTVRHTHRHTHTLNTHTLRTRHAHCVCRARSTQWAAGSCVSVCLYIIYTGVCVCVSIFMGPGARSGQRVRDGY